MVKIDLLADLNQEQRQAVTHRTGPLLVIAGAGTGKTTIITRRIAWLIAERLAQPSEILALTFTEKAAGEMEARVDQLLPLGITDVVINTFHAFGDNLLREYALDIGLPPEFRVLESAEQTLFLAERFDQIEGLDELRPTNNPTKFIPSIIKVISRAKDELVSPERYRKVAEKLIKQATDDESRRAAVRQLEIAKIYAAYEEFKSNEGIIDFGDQITKLVELLDREPAITKRLRRRFKFILVDEFQDTNIAQFELVKRLLSPEQNLTVVGDDDQAIYKFRGAALSNILNFLKFFPTAQQVIVRHNYRSSQPILDAAYRLIQGNNPDRLESTLKIDKRLISQIKNPTITPPIFHWFSHDVDELDDLVTKIKTEAQKTPLNQIAILVRTNALLSPIAAALSREGIAYAASSDQGFIQLPEIQGVIAFFHALIHPSDSVAYVKLAFSPFYQFEPAWILAINDAAKKNNSTFAEELENETSPAWTNLSEAGKIALRGLRNDLATYRQLLGSKMAGEILYQFLKDRGVLQVRSHTIANPSQGLANHSRNEGGRQLNLFDSQPEEKQLAMIQNLSAVFDAIGRYQAASRDPFVLSFVDQLDKLLENIVPPRVDLGPDIPAVQLLTVHSAKGLEFDVVFLPFLTADRFPARRKSELLALPEELITESLPTGDEHLEEERRLAYVAMTRARYKLYLSGSAKSGDGVRTKRPSPFIFEALGITNTPPPITRVSPESRLNQFAPRLPAPIALKLPTYDGIFFLSPAMIEAYVTDPYQFYWRYVLKVPQEPSRHLVYGNAIHAAIEAYHRLRLKGGPVTTGDILTRYHEAWKSEGFNSKEDEERQFKHGEAVLMQFMARAADRPLPTKIEETFTIQVPGARIRGRMDAIYEKRGEIRDFKTSDVRDQKDADAKIKANIPIMIYALAYQHRYGKLPDRLVLEFVEKGIEAVLVPDDQLIDSIQLLISDVINGIRSGRFEPNPNHPFKDYE